MNVTSIKVFESNFTKSLLMDVVIHYEDGTTKTIYDMRGLDVAKLFKENNLELPEIVENHWEYRLHKKFGSLPVT